MASLRSAGALPKLGSTQSTFRGLSAAFQRVSISSPPQLRHQLNITASRVCDLTGKKANNGYNVTFSHKRNRKLQQPNLQDKKVYWPEGKRWVRLKLCTKAIKTIDKRGLSVMAKEAGINLWKLPFEDARSERTEWLATHEHNPPMAKDPRKMKNPERLAASKKTPLVARYLSGKVVYIREGSDLSEL
ncbi:50S ribosomal protein L28 [Auxenochlorella protothecoides]|uniref:Large ribosomal subunit protein bL28c n=1 Tax=Auxenochlorella protothecoides TaxID=3075 RepID=A0A087SU02_AUXPR|nr:50S ribosomal protein L28 [Auxenochlorella protothecoides]KFM29206.1 50S ribosomal protein L28 [Auxenochlorella protothecoides]RMZ55445.1 hypothetical protein APUTEX25_003569 [Auxenochlorella protothecoides]|eukprot:RMZ55445.1 hypothetical protein APUTEX25_003569 [Auxenochlorella protothecoides]